jgi:hypothetical protein
MKLLITLEFVCVVSFDVLAVMFGLKGEWPMMALMLFYGLFWAGCCILRYKDTKRTPEI